MAGDINPGKIWKSGDTVTAAGLNAFLSDSTIKDKSITLAKLSAELQTVVQNIQDGVFKTLYKVGDFLPSDNGDLAERFGGTWARVAQGQFLLGADPDAAEPKYPVGQTGGEEEHTLTVDEIPEHNHPLQPQIVADWRTGGEHLESSGGNLERGGENPVSGARGGGKAHNNMPPYIVTNWWKKVSDLPKAEFKVLNPTEYAKYFKD